MFKTTEQFWFTLDFDLEYVQSGNKTSRGENGIGNWCFPRKWCNSVDFGLQMA